MTQLTRNIVTQLRVNLTRSKRVWGANSQQDIRWCTYTGIACHLVGTLETVGNGIIWNELFLFTIYVRIDII